MDEADAGRIAARMLLWAGVTTVPLARVGAGTEACPAPPVPASGSIHRVKPRAGIPRRLLL